MSLLRVHVRRDHTSKIYLTYKGGLTVDFVGCLKRYGNADTFAKYLNEHGQGESVTVVRSNDECAVLKNNAIDPLKRRNLADVDIFTSSEGSQKALKLNSERQASCMTKALYCEPIAIHPSHDSMVNSHGMYGVFSTNDIYDAQVHYGQIFGK
ncbi:hypothetical protein INT48_003507 [Thamnidium elegans]|uniref:Uncharacterized protein n=1 Tax=Thamnidium elegans TaxID=101142 RepID=A0A8H7W085_9FUNG|nr:hypothetical protein INT48_003507 [Thamnidium elegans]